MVSGCVLAVRGGLQAVRPWRFRNGTTGVRGLGCQEVLATHHLGADSCISCGLEGERGGGIGGGRQ